MGNKLPLRILRGILCLAFWIFVWQMLALAVRRVLVLPTPLAVAKTLGSLLSDGEFYLVCLWSLGRIFAGLLIGLFAGLLLASLDKKTKKHTFFLKTYYVWGGDFRHKDKKTYFF